MLRRGDRRERFPCGLQPRELRGGRGEHAQRGGRVSGRTDRVRRLSTVSPRQRYARHVVHRSTTGVPRTLEGAAIGHCFDPWRKMGARGDQGAASGPRTEFWPELEREQIDPGFSIKLPSSQTEVCKYAAALTCGTTRSK